MSNIYRYTTPTVGVKLTYTSEVTESIVSDSNVYITLQQKKNKASDEIQLTKEATFDATTDIASITLTQAESAKFNKGKIKAQVDGIDSTGFRWTGPEESFTVKDLLHDEVITHHA